MKKLSIISVILFNLAVVQQSTAQIVKGSIPFAASLNLIRSNYDNKSFMSSATHTVSYYSVSPSVGYFIVDNLAIGLGFSYNYSRSYSENINLDPSPYVTSSKSTEIRQSLQIAPCIHYYIHLSDKAYFSINGSAGYTLPISYHNKTENTSGGITTSIENNDVKFYSINGSVAPGVLFFLNDRFAIQGSIGSLYYSYNHSQDDKVSYDNYSNDSGAGLNLNLSSISLGAQYFFVRKQSKTDK
jgi:outer membrane protein